MKYVLLSLLSLCCLAACQKPETTGPALDGKELAERFIKPAGGKAIAGVVFNEQGDTIAVTADGKIIEPCRLATMEGDNGAASAGSPDDSKLTECHGVTNTSIYKISQITAVRHKGSNCMTFATPVGGYVYIRTYCW